MEATESMNAGVTAIRDEGPLNYHVAANTENPTLVTGAPMVVASPMTAGVVESMEKKRRGRPRKYGLGGSHARVFLQMPISLSAPPLQPMPISSSAPPLQPLPISSSAPPPPTTEKQGRGRPIGSENKQRNKVRLEKSGEVVDFSAGVNFMPHLITVNKGEDITMKIISFTKQRPRAVSIMSAVGSISNATLRLPGSSGDTLTTYEGIFDIISLQGSFTPADVGKSGVSRSGGLSVSLSSPDGRVIAGTLAGLLVAGGPVQVVMCSFLPGWYQEQKHKKQKLEPNLAHISPGSAAAFPTSAGKEGFGTQDHNNSAAPNPNLPSSSINNWSSMTSEPNLVHNSPGSAAGFPTSGSKEGFSTQEQNNSAAPNPNLPSSSINNWASMETTPDFRQSTTDINISLQGASAVSLS